MVVSVDQARHDDVAGGINHLGAIRLQARTDCGDAIVFDQHVAGREIGHIGIHRDDNAAFEDSAGILRRVHGWFLRGT
jgi:hypothetical protein